MDDQNKNLLLATVLSFLVILIWFVLFPPPEEPPADPNAPTTAESVAPDGPAPAPPVAAPQNPAADPGQTAAAGDVAASDAARVAVETPSLRGSISLRGGRVDDLSLKHYEVSLEDGAPQVELLSPVGSAGAYYALYGWSPAGDLDLESVPSANTEWQIESGETLSPGQPVTLRWDDGGGLIFRRTFEIDDRYLFTVRQSIENTTDRTVRAAPYGIVARHGEPTDLRGFFIIHEGAISMTDGELTEIDYSDMPDLDAVPREAGVAEITEVEENGWIGFTDHYWMTSLIPEPGQPFTAVTKYVPSADIYQTEARLPTLTVQPGQTAQSTQYLFAGAKEYETIRAYEAGRPIAGFWTSLSYALGFAEQQGIVKFLDSIDWGWFFFLTKPIFFVLHELNGLIGNMGWSIIVLTLFIKALLFPLAYKSYVSMAKMKELQPEMEKIKERAGDDRQKLQQEIMGLYKKEKVNPASGCLPILMQIPIFFSLYKVIFVTIELRHAEWFGPFRDLSAPDPTSIFNVFGLLPWGAPEPGSIVALIFIGILPLLLGISMWLQQKLNPAPTDPTQAAIFAWMPWVFMFMLGGFASGLVIYWIANNTITFTQQYAIMRSQGYKPDVFGNIRRSFGREKG